jgi:hypothetical protein
MEKVKGIVMKTTKKKTILYTERGDYLEIRTPSTPPLLGQVIEVDSLGRNILNQKLLNLASIAAVLLLALGLGVFNIVSSANTAVAAVVMDINNSKELFVNRDAKVLRVIDLTQGSKPLTSEIQLQGKDIYTSVDLLIDQANSQETLNGSNNLVMASIIPLDNRQEEVIDQAKLQDSIRRHILEKNISADLMVSQTDETTQKTAQNLGMSVNNYLVYKRLMDKGLVANTNRLNPNDTNHMLSEANTTLHSLFPQESMTIPPQSGTRQEEPSSMGTPMSGEKMPSSSPPASGSSQNKSPSSMKSTLPPSNNSMPANPPMSSTPSTQMPMQGGSGSQSGSGTQGMMR